MSSTNNNYKQGDIVWVKYPFSDQPDKAKARPAVVVSHERSNQLDHDLIVAPVTSRIRGDAFSFLLTPDDTNVALPQMSEVRSNKMVTIRSMLMEKKITQLKPEALERLIEQVCETFRLDE